MESVKESKLNTVLVKWVCWTNDTLAWRESWEERKGSSFHEKRTSSQWQALRKREKRIHGEGIQTFRLFKEKEILDKEIDDGSIGSKERTLSTEKSVCPSLHLFSPFPFFVDVYWQKKEQTLSLDSYFEWEKTADRLIPKEKVEFGHCPVFLSTKKSKMCWIRKKREKLLQNDNCHNTDTT